jgi:hypothetical protein
LKKKYDTDMKLIAWGYALATADYFLRNIGFKASSDNDELEAVRTKLASFIVKEKIKIG